MASENEITLGTFDKLCPLAAKMGWKSHFGRGMGNHLTPPNPDAYPVFTSTPGEKLNQAQIVLESVCPHCIYGYIDPTQMGGMAPPGKCEPGLTETPDGSGAIAINIRGK